jgi:hypothetical protein
MGVKRARGIAAEVPLEFVNNRVVHIVIYPTP